MHAWLKKILNRQLMKDVELRWPIFENHTSLEDYIDIAYGALKSCKLNFTFAR
jgi:hypothetical protein